MKILKLIFTTLLLLLFGALITALSMSSPVGAAPLSAPAPNQLPLGNTLNAGSASVSVNGSTMSIHQSTQQAAMSWSSFNIGDAATVNVVQPSSSSILLNQVLSNSPTQILGHLNANGQVFLSNPSGIYFAPGASVNVGGLVATTNSISTSDFMAGLSTFSSSSLSAKIVNEGNLQSALGGYIALLAPTVVNNGVIIAQMGTVALAAGNQYVLQFKGEALNALIVTPANIATLVKNGNAVLAPGGLIILTAQGAHQIKSAIVGNSGVLDATGITSDGGLIKLTATQTINAGGYITANAAANSDANGGSISIISDLNNAKSQTTVTGVISAQGGNLGGVGGAVETSGSRVTVASGATVNTLASKGKPGTWTLDPTDFIIDSVANGGDISAATLDLNLTTSNVVISSVNGKSGIQGNIQVNQGINWLAANSLTLNAINNVVVSQSITENAVNAKLIINAGNDIDINAPIVSNAVSTSINLNAGNNVNINSPITINGVSSGLSILAKQNIVSSALISSVAAATSQITLTAEDNVIIGGGISIAGVSAQLNVNATQDTQINSPLIGLGATTSINLSSGRDITTSGNAVMTTTGAASNIYLIAGRNLTVGAAVSTVGASSPVELYSGMAGTSPGLASGTVVLNAPVTGTTVAILFNPDSYANTSIDIARYPVGTNAKALIYLAAANKVYDSTTLAGSLSMVGSPILGASVSLIPGIQNFSSSNVGTSIPINYSGYSLGGSNAAMFSLVPNQRATSANITVAPLIFTAVATPKTYDGTTSGSAVFSENPFSGDQVTISASTVNFSNPNVGTGIAVTVAGITASGPSAANYSITPTLLISGNITQAPLLVSASNSVKNYGQTFIATQFTQSGLVNAETIGSVSFTSAGFLASAGVPLSPYAVSPVNARGGTFQASNYSITYANGYLYVLPVGLLITVADVWKPLGTSFIPTAFSVAGLVNGDTMGALAMSSPGDAASATIEGNPYVIKASPVSGGTFNASNYTVQYVNGTLTVRPL